MILSCPACATRYTIDASKMGREGRTVRCTSCRHTWHAAGIEQKPIELAVEAKPERPRTEDLKSVKPTRLPSKYREILQDKKRLRQLAAQGVVWAGLAAAMVLVLVGAWLFKVDIVRTFPALAGAYQSVGVKVNPTGLEMQSYTAEAGLKGGRFVVTVQAKIRNLRNAPTPVPPVRVKLYDASQSIFDTRLIPSHGLVVAPGETRTLVFDVADPRNLTNALDLGFDMVAMKHQKPGEAHGAEAGSEHDEPEPQPNSSAPVTQDHGAPLRDSHGGHATTDQPEHAAEAHTPAAGQSAPHKTDAAHDTHAPTAPALRDTGHGSGHG